MKSPAPALLGVAFVAIAVGCFAALDTTTKFVAASVPLVMTIWVRYLFQAVVTSVTLVPTRGWKLLHTKRPLMQCVRALCVLISSVLAFLSLEYMPVGEFTAIVLLSPLLITLLAATSLGERVSVLRWTLVAGGFIGAMIVIRPGASSFTWATLLPLGLVVMNSAYQIITSQLAKVEDVGTMQFYTGLIGAVLTSFLLPFAWQALSPSLWSLLLLLGVLSTFGHFMLILAYKKAPVAVLTPYLYLQIGFGTLGGWLVFSHTPDHWSFTGITVIAVCGAAGTWLTARESRALQSS